MSKLTDFSLVSDRKFKRVSADRDISSRYNESSLGLYNKRNQPRLSCYLSDESDLTRFELDRDQLKRRQDLARKLHAPRK